MVEMKEFREYLWLLLESKYIHGMMVVGPSGLRKTHIIMQELQERNLKYALYNAHATSLSLYETLYINRDNVVVLDDIDTLLDDRKSVAVLKAALFSVGDRREVTWNSTTRLLEDRGLPPRFAFNGKIIIIANDEKNSKMETFRALKSRMYVYRMKISMAARKILVRSIILRENIFDMPTDKKEYILNYIEKNITGANTEHYNLRNVIKACEIYKMRGEEGLPLIDRIFEVDVNMKKFIYLQEKGAALPAMKKVEIWKKATGLSAQSYYNLRSKYFVEKHEEEEALARELEEIDQLIRGVRVESNEDERVSQES